MLGGGRGREMHRREGREVRKGEIGE